MQVNVTHPSQLNEPGPRSEGSLRREDERSGDKQDQGPCNGTGLVGTARGAAAEIAGPSFNLNQRFEEEYHVAYLRFF
jgi:hypothetical protein